MEPFKARMLRLGNALGFEIPPTIVRELDLREGDIVEVALVPRREKDAAASAPGRAFRSPDGVPADGPSARS